MVGMKIPWMGLTSITHQEYGEIKKRKRMCMTPLTKMMTTVEHMTSICHVWKRLTMKEKREVANVLRSSKLFLNTSSCKVGGKKEEGKVRRLVLWMRGRAAYLFKLWVLILTITIRIPF